MDREFWLNRWSSGQIGFHQQAPNPRLVEFAARVGAAESRVFVPLAGKSNDMAWLASHGHDVVGVELSREAVVAFYEEHSLTPAVSQTGALERFEAGGVTLFVGDYFDLERMHVGDVDWVFDRAAYYALPKELRDRYVSHLASLLAPSARSLLLTISYDQTKAPGPPFSVEDDEVRAAHAPWFSLEVLRHDAVDIANQRLIDAGVREMHETTWMLTRLA